MHHMQNCRDLTLQMQAAPCIHVLFLTSPFPTCSALQRLDILFCLAEGDFIGTWRVESALRIGTGLGIVSIISAISASCIGGRQLATVAVVPSGTYNISFPQAVTVTNDSAANSYPIYTPQQADLWRDNPYGFRAIWTLSVPCSSHVHEAVFSVWKTAICPFDNLTSHAAAEYVLMKHCILYILYKLRALLFVVRVVSSV